MSDRDPEAGSDEYEELPPRSDADVVERAATRGAERAVQEFRSISVERSSLLPDPDELARYEHQFPGLGSRIVTWTEDELNHRRSLERRGLDASLRLASRGQSMAFAWAVLALSAAVFLAIEDKDAGAISALAAALVPALIGVLGVRRGRRSRD